MKIEDVNENEMVTPRQTQTQTQMTDDEYIKNSLQALNTKAVNKAQSKPVSTPINQGMDKMDLSQIINGNNGSNFNGINYNDTSSNFWELDKIPSMYRLYPDGTKISGRPLKVLEVKKLSSLNEVNADYIINDILKKTIRGINIDDIYIADKMYMILWLRANSFRDSSYRVDFHCEKCDTESDFHFDIDNIESKYLSETYDPNRVLTLGSGESVKIKFMTIGDVNKVDRYKEMNKGSLMELDAEVLTVASMISEINGEAKSTYDKYTFVVNLDPQDFSMIVSYIDKFGMGIQPYMNVKCAKCGGVSQLAVTFHQSFFFPSYKFD